MSLKGKRVLIFVEDGYEDLEFWYPKIRLTEEGVKVVAASKETGVYRGKHGYEAKAEVRAADVDPDDFDGVIIPGGTVSPDRLRRHKEVLDLVRGMDRRGKVVAAICHGPWVLISAGIVRRRRLTSYFSIKDDMVNAGAKYMEGKPVVVDGNVITSRNPGDLPDFCKAIIKTLSKAGGD